MNILKGAWCAVFGHHRVLRKQDEWFCCSRCGAKLESIHNPLIIRLETAPIWAYECSKGQGGIHHWVRNDDGTATCRRCQERLTKDDADDYDRASVMLLQRVYDLNDEGRLYLKGEDHGLCD